MLVCPFHGLRFCSVGTSLPSYSRTECDSPVLLNEGSALFLLLIRSPESDAYNCFRSYPCTNHLLTSNPIRNSFRITLLVPFMLSFTDRMCCPPVLHSSIHFLAVSLEIRKPEKTELYDRRGRLEALPLNQSTTLRQQQHYVGNPE